MLDGVIEFATRVDLRFQAQRQERRQGAAGRHHLNQAADGAKPMQLGLFRLSTLVPE